MTRLWIGAVSVENCQFEKDNGYPLNYEGWDASQPACDSSGNPQCVYLDVGVVSDNWKVGNCYMRDAFACQG